jgi:hypothetical protein
MLPANKVLVVPSFSRRRRKLTLADNAPGVERQLPGTAAN